MHKCVWNVHGHRCAREHTCSHLHVEVNICRSTFGVIISHSSFEISHSSFEILNLTNMLRLAGQKDLAVPTSPGMGLQAHATMLGGY